MDMNGSTGANNMALRFSNKGGDNLFMPMGRLVSTSNQGTWSSSDARDSKPP